MRWTFFGAFRGEELLGAKGTGGLNWEEGELGEEGVVVWLRQSKTDQRAGGKQVRLAKYQEATFCPLRRGAEWRERQRDEVGGVFRHQDGSRL